MNSKEQPHKFPDGKNRLPQTKQKKTSLDFLLETLSEAESE